MANNVNMIENLYTSVESALFLGDRLNNSEFSMLMQPGQFVSLDLKEMDSSEDMAIQYELVNDGLDTSFLYKPTNSTIGQKYSDILQNAALPHTNLTDAQQAEINNINAWISQNIENYEVFRDRYYDALEAFDQEAHKEHPNGPRLQRLAQKRDDALDNWKTVGQKTIWESKQARLVQLTSGNPEVMWNQFRNRLASQTKIAPLRGAYYQTFFIPSISNWNSPNTSWAQCEKIVTDTENHNSSRSTSWGGGFGGWGLFKFIRVGANGEKHEDHQSCEVSTVNIKFEYLRVRIHRPWLISDIFGYHFWTWKRDIGFTYLSDGGNLTANPPIRPTGELPLVSKNIIVARNVELSANFTSNDKTLVESQINGGLSAGWGPFSFRGSYSHSDRTEDFRASFDGTTIRISQPQIIAITGNLLPKSPNPDSHLPWQDDAIFPQALVGR